MQFSKFLHNAIAVSSICNAKPLRSCIENLNCSLAAIDEGIDCEGDEELSLGCIDVLVEEFFELTL